MPHFHFNVLNDTRAIDYEGVALPDLDAAIANADQGARELIAENVLAGRVISKRHCIEITDVDGELLHTVRFGQIIQLTP